MKRNKTKIKELKKELHYFQMMASMEIRWYKLSCEKVKEIAKKMKELQKEIL